jgi:hypothetical protein
MYNVAPQCSPNRNESSATESSLRVATSGSASRTARAAVMHALAAADSDPAVSARKNATMPSPAWRPTMPPASTMHRSAVRTRRRPNAKYCAVERARQRRRRIQVGHQNRCRPPIGTRDGAQPFEMR